MMLDYNRQDKIFNPENQRFKIVVFGAGSLGSFITLNLAKLGFNDIVVYDTDIVERWNIPNQFYRYSDIGKKKTTALKEIVKDFTGITIDIQETWVDSNNIDTIIAQNGIGTLYVLTFDSLESRKVVFEGLKHQLNFLVDSRLGGEEYSIYTSKMSDAQDLKNHSIMYNIIPTELECGMKSVIYSVLAVSAEVCNIVKKINQNEVYPKSIIRHMKRNFILTDVR